MADDHTQRPYRSNEPPARNTPAAASDPLAELARLIGQNDPFAEFGRDSARRAAPSSAPAWSAPAAQSQSEAPPATPKYGASGYYAASTAPAAPPPEAQPYGAPVTRQPHANSPYAANADRYRTEDETPDYPTAPAGYRAGAYQQNQMPHAGEEDEIYDDAPPPRRRIGIMAIAAVFALAVIGTAGAFGYRAMFGSSGANLSPPVIKSDTAQIKVVPASTGKTSGKLITERLTDHAQDEKLVSREEKPVEVTSTPPAGAMTPSQDGAPQSANQAALGSGVISSEPKKVHTIAIHPDQASLGNSQPPSGARQAGPSPVRPIAPSSRAANNAPPVADNPEPPPAPRQTEARAATPERQAAATPRGNAPLSLSPNAAPAARTAMRTASVPAASAKSAAAGSGSYVQLSSQRSEADAQSAFRGLQAKYPTQLSNRQPVIRKVELGGKGTYYRAMVGPLAGNEATELCTGLKAAGGQCLIQRN